MIAGLPLPYAYARGSARLALRPAEHHWRDWHAARGLAVLIDAVRGSPFADSVGGIAPGANADAIELALGVQLRARIAEVAAWAPDDWRAALLWTQRLVDLPLRVHLAGGGAASEWMRAEPLAAECSGNSAPPPPQPSPAGGGGRDLRSPHRRAQGVRHATATTALHPALLDWLAQWRALWPPQTADERAALDALTATVAQHLARFAVAAPDTADALRTELQTRLTAFARLHAAEPVALFALLALHALDLERLRGELLLRALFPAGAKS